MSDEFRPGEPVNPLPDNTPAPAENDGQTTYIPGSQARNISSRLLFPRCRLSPDRRIPGRVRAANTSSAIPQQQMPPAPPSSPYPYYPQQQPASYQPPYVQQPGYSPYPPQQPGKGMAVASLVMGILSIVFAALGLCPCCLPFWD